MTVCLLRKKIRFVDLAQLLVKNWRETMDMKRELKEQRNLLLEMRGELFIKINLPSDEMAFLRTLCSSLTKTVNAMMDRPPQIGMPITDLPIPITEESEMLRFEENLSQTNFKTRVVSKLQKDISLTL